MVDIPALDRPVYGAKNIGRIANLIDEKTGDVDLQATFYALARGLIPAEKFGRRWRSTARRILKGVRYIPPPKKSDTTQVTTASPSG
jgi:hypothetical protein